jgi:hypothetical protein
VRRTDALGKTVSETAQTEESAAPLDTMGQLDMVSETTNAHSSARSPQPISGARGHQRSILMIAYHFPPCNVSSGLQRTLGFLRHMPEHGWQPLVLSAHPRAYSSVANDQLKDVPASVPVHRAFALDTAVHLGFRKRYFNWMALPDRWVSWLIGAVPAGLAMIARHQPKVLWSTYPIATAHLIAYVLHRLTGIPWVADLRDPMVEIDPVTKQQWPIDPTIRRTRLWVERLTLRHCTRAVFASPGSLRIYQERYPEVARKHLVLIQNGYEEDSFREAEALPKPQARGTQQIVLLHSGVLYPSPDRHPGAFFSALGSLMRAGEISPSNLKVILRASSYEDGYRQLIQKEKLDEIVFLEPGIPYRQALAEMLSVDALLIFQGHDSNPAIPAKLYEYFRARRPIFAMADASGDTAGEIRGAGIGTIVPLDSADEIAAGLSKFLSDLRAGRGPVLSASEIRRHSRANKTMELVRLLDEVVDQRVA